MSIDTLPPAYRQYKYNILYLMHYRLSQADARTVDDTLYEELQVSERTWKRYKYLRLQDGLNIPQEHLFTIARLFDVSVEDLVNQDHHTVTIAQLREKAGRISPPENRKKHGKSRLATGP